MSEAASPSTPPAAPPPSSIQLIDLTSHPDGELLRMLSRGTSLREREWSERLPRGKHLGKDRRREYNQLCHDIWKLDMAIIKHPARTKLGVHAKALYALEHEDAEGNAPTYGMHGLLFSVLSDALRIGALA